MLYSLQHSHMPTQTRTKVQRMRIQATKPWFAWEELEDSPTLKTIQPLL